MKNIKDSLEEILNERLSSPLYGTFIVTWLLWNWKIIYLTIFVNQDKIEGTKIDYILVNYFHWHDLILFPIISTGVLICVLPLLTNSAYWFNYKFKSWRKKAKLGIDQEEPISRKQATALKKMVREKEKEYEDIIERRDARIKELQSENTDFHNSFTLYQTQSLKEKNDLEIRIKQLESKPSPSIEVQNDNENLRRTNRKLLAKVSQLENPKLHFSTTYLEMKKYPNIFEYFKNNSKHISDHSNLGANVNEEIEEYLFLNDIVSKEFPMSGDTRYKLTKTGINLRKEIFNSILAEKNKPKSDN